MEVNMRSNCNEFDVPLENNNNNNINNDNIIEEEEHVDVVEEEEEEKENENEYLIFANASYRRLSSLIPLITIKHKHSYKIYFTKWKDITRSYMHSSRIRTSSSSSHINQMIINNMSTVLLTCENDLSKLKLSLRINTILIRLIITKHNMTMLTYISKWFRNSYTKSNYTALMSQYETLKKRTTILLKCTMIRRTNIKKQLRIMNI
jgi:hypothetical protein